jgi:hypothetical protein
MKAMGWMCALVAGWAAALKSGVSAHAKYDDGVAVFTMGQTGLMYGASVGRQKFSFQPIQTP